VENEQMFVYNNYKTRGGGLMQKYIGKIVQLIYIDSKKEVSIRNVKIYAAGDNQFKAYCYQAKAVRTFNLNGVVDIELLNNRLLGLLKDAQQYNEDNKRNTV